MTKKLLTLLITACFLLTICSCSDKKEANIDLSGIWAEKTSERVVLKIEENEKNDFSVDITWREDLPQKEIWSMTANKNGDNLEYTGGIYLIRQYDNNGFTDDVKYQDGSGSFRINENELIWHNNENDEDIIFIPAEQYKDVFSDESNIIKK